MIHEIRIKNFFSVRDEIVLDFTIAKNAPDRPQFRKSLSRPEIRVPTVVTLFGPNAAGKSNILRALTATVSFVIRSFDLAVDAKIPWFYPFMTNEGLNQPIEIEFKFDAGWLEERPELFSYELKLCPAGDSIQPSSVLYESLKLFPKGGGRPRRIFERAFEKETYLGSEFNLKRGDSLIEAVRPNASVISTLAKLNNSFSQKIWTDLANLQSNLWGLNRNALASEAVLNYYVKNPDTLQILNRELKRIDLGISDMEINTGEETGLYAWFNHKYLAAPILWDEESSGTQHFINMFPLINFVISAGHVAIFDEFDADLHPDLVREIFEWFYSQERNEYNAQLLVTAHNSIILDYLEKEQVVIVEKEENGNTLAYVAQDISGLRRDTRLLNKYMGGSLGGLPHIG